jgi:hypothetical protein
VLGRIFADEMGTGWCHPFSQVHGYKNPDRMANSGLFSSSQEYLEVSAISSVSTKLNDGKYHLYPIIQLGRAGNFAARGRPERGAGSAARALSATGCAAPSRQTGAESPSATDRPGTGSQYSSRADLCSNRDRAELELSRHSVSN